MSGELFIAGCKRCGKNLFTTKRAEKGYAILNLPFPLCEDCTLPSERNKILEFQAEQIIAKGDQK